LTVELKNKVIERASIIPAMVAEVSSPKITNIKQKNDTVDKGKKNATFLKSLISKVYLSVLNTPIVNEELANTNINNDAMLKFS